MNAKHTETLDKLYLEWSQFTKARTGLELQMLTALKLARKSIASGFDTVSAIAAIDSAISRAEQE